MESYNMLNQNQRRPKIGGKNQRKNATNGKLL